MRTTSTNLKLIGVLSILGMLLTNSSARADSFVFSFSNNVGNYGIANVTGDITIPVACTVTCAATTVTLAGPLSFDIQLPGLTNPPYYVSTVPNGNVLTWNVTANSFTESAAGALTSLDLDASITYIDSKGFSNTVNLNLDDSTNGLFLAGNSSLSDTGPPIPYPPGDPDIAGFNNLAVTATPEPAIWSLLVLGLSALALLKRARMKDQSRPHLLSPSHLEQSKRFNHR